MAAHNTFVKGETALEAMVLQLLERTEGLEQTVDTLSKKAPYTAASTLFHICPTPIHIFFRVYLLEEPYLAVDPTVTDPCTGDFLHPEFVQETLERLAELAVRPLSDVMSFEFVTHRLVQDGCAIR